MITRMEVWVNLDLDDIEYVDIISSRIGKSIISPLKGATKRVVENGNL